LIVNLKFKLRKQQTKFMMKFNFILAAVLLLASFGFLSGAPTFGILNIFKRSRYSPHGYRSGYRPFGYGSGYGSGYSSGYGSGYGSGYDSGSVFGSGTSYGPGYGYGSSYGYGSDVSGTTYTGFQ
jgi:hypothetical protein